MSLSNIFLTSFGLWLINVNFSPLLNFLTEPTTNRTESTAPFIWPNRKKKPNRHFGLLDRTEENLTDKNLDRMALAWASAPMGKTRQLPGPGIRDLLNICYKIKHMELIFWKQRLWPGPGNFLPTPENYSADAHDARVSLTLIFTPSPTMRREPSRI